MPAYAGAATAELTPGTTSNGTPPAPCVRDQERVDLFLRQGVIAARLAREDPARTVSFAQQPTIDEPVVDHDVRAAQQREPAHRHEPWIAGPGADEGHRA